MTDLEELEVARHTGHLIRRAQQRHLAIWQRDVSSEISSVQFAVLTVLGATPGVSQKEVGDVLDLDRSTIADLVGRMAKRNLLERHRDPIDKRKNNIELSELGAAELRRLRPLVDNIEAPLTAGLSKDQRSELRDHLRAIVDAPL